jgi:DNA-binding NarL/FixJ family response regulator
MYCPVIANLADLMNFKNSALVVEDNPDAREWLVKCLSEAYPELAVSQAATLGEGMQHVRQQPLELALIDLGLPDGSGMDLIREIRARQPHCQIIVATIYDDDKNLFTALKAGAQGYILKDQDKHKIIGYLHGLKQNRPAISDASSRRLIEHFNQQGSELKNTRLTPREHDVVVLLSQGYTVEQAAGSLGISTETVRGYIKSIYQKLGISNRAELALAAVRLGITG